MPHVTAINVYPIKSCRGVPLTETVVEPRGLEHDRRYMLVDGKGRFLSQRAQPRLAAIRVRIDGDGLLVEAPEQPELRLPLALPAERECRVRIWRDSLEAGLAEPSVNRWFTRYLGFDCGLVHMAAHQHRALDHEAAGFDDEVSFADAAPLLLTSQASLDELNARLARKVSMRRFRPNVVVSAAPAFAEDGWGRIRIGRRVELDVAWPCRRCVVTTIDPDTGERAPDGEPLETLKAFRRGRGGVMFGQNLIPRALGEIRVGDEVTLQ